MKKNREDQAKEPPVTYDVYAELPDDGQRYEVLGGVLELMSPGPATAHQAVSRELEFLFMKSCRMDYIIFDAPVDVILSESNVVQPDILMVHRSRQHIVTKRGIEGSPDLVVEILSPGSRKRDKVRKFAIYEEHGVPEYWIIDAESRTLEQFQLSDGGRYALVQVFEGNDPVTSTSLPCVSFIIDELFRDMPV
ncbi:Uma2 family endonuclease [Paenibacillus sp. HB172176]|uniref:Uma2 family endonuclease n=1 Tax=Paenibacillus sp. HB172176 TaxID=2493690 RepID=UPI00143ADC44|nr:Uma2 family endonuclease [Paenibacillus sp. HB172176]